MSKRTSEPLKQTAAVLLEEGWQARDVGRSELAHERFIRSIETANRAGDRTALANGLLALADNVLHYWPATDDALFDLRLRLCQQALTLFRDIGDERGIASCLRMLAIVGPPGKTNALLNESLEISRRLKWNKGVVLGLLAIAANAWLAAETQDAVRLGSEALAHARESGDDRLLAASLNSMALLIQETGRRRELFEEYHTVCRRRGWPKNLLQGLLVSAGLGCEDDDWDTKETYLHESLRVAQELGDSYNEGFVLSWLADISRARGDEPGAIALERKSRAVSQPIEIPAGFEEALASRDVQAIAKVLGWLDSPSSAGNSGS